MKAQRKLYQIADEIANEWGGKVYFGAKPYLQAMQMLDSVNDSFGADSGDSIIRYFLGNATTWRGETARRIKKELNDMLK